MGDENPNLEWYVGVSQKKNLPHPRCPFATSERCPRYFQSLSLLGSAGATRIPEDRDNELLAYWKQTDLWPLTDEQATSLSGSNGRLSFANFCPEVAAQHSGFFASFLSPWYDDEEKESFLDRRLPAGDSYKWHWSFVKEMHYSECPMFSLLPYLGTREPKKNERVLETSPDDGRKSEPVPKEISRSDHVNFHDRIARWTFCAGGFVCVLGVVLFFIGDRGAGEIKVFEQEIRTTSVGLGSVFLGVILMLFNTRSVLHSFNQASHKSLTDSGTVLQKFSLEEEEILQACAKSGEIRVLTIDAFGNWVRAGDVDFMKQEDPSFAAKYLEAFQALQAKGLAVYQGGHLYRLTGSGFEIARRPKGG